MLCVVLIAAVAGSCNVITNEENPRRPPDVFDQVRAIDLLPRFPQQTGTTSTAPPGGGLRPSTYYGDLQAAAEKPTFTGAQAAASGEGYELNFENTPVTGVAKVVLGDILGLGYMVDPRVQGTVTLSSGRAVAKGDLLFVLESALRLSGAALVRDKGGYIILPGADATGSGTVDAVARTEPGYGITVIPLQHVSAPTVIKLLDSFALKPGTVRAEPARNLVLIQGSGTDRRTAIQTVMDFDADWMRGQSVGIFPLHNSAPEAIMSELERIMDSGEGGLSASLVKLQPIARLNAVMVVSAKPALLKTAGMWITRLDKSDTASTGIKVYHVRYGDAKQIAFLLNDIFVGRSGGGLDSASNQIAPGAGVSLSSSGSDQPGLRIPGARTSPGSSPSGSSAGFGGPGGVGGGGLGSQGASASDIVASRSGPFGRGAAGASSGASSGSTFGSAATPGAGGVLPGVRITADTVNNTLLIYANQESYRIIEQTLRQLDRPQLQVAIDATIAEITLNDSLSYGVQFFIKGMDVGAHDDKGSAGLSTGASAIIARTLPGFNFLLGPELEPRMILQALHNVTDVKVLSTPSVVVMDNQIATLQVGDQVPVATATATVIGATGAPIVNTIDYRNTGVILRVIPRINANGNVLLDIEQEISNVSTTANTGTLTPTVSQRKVKSSIGVASGQTVLLAGLISENTSGNRSGIPLVDQLGELGKLIGSNSKATQRTELIIFIRPQIIRDGVDAMRVAEELRTKLRGKLGTTQPIYRQQ
jgi:general secretion pathway protein D